MLPDLAGIEPATSWSPVGRASDKAIEAGNASLYRWEARQGKNGMFLCFERIRFSSARAFTTVVVIVVRKLATACSYIITKTCLYNIDPLKPHFYIVKLGFTLFFLFLLKNIDCGYLLESPRRGGSSEYPQSIFWAEMWKKNIRIFYLKIFLFWL